MREQAQAFVQHIGPDQAARTHLRRDRDGAYQPGFDATLRAAGIQVERTSYRSPNLQAYVERFIQSIQQECLDHFIVCGERHFDHLVREYVEHYHTERPHQAKGNVPLTGDWPEPRGEPPPNGEIDCRTRLGGLLKSYHRAAA
jgi:putative transposase